MNRKGFTLIELLATIIILSLLMIVAVPNVMSTIDKNKKATYISDAKKMITLAEYKVRSDSSIVPPNNESECVVITLGALDLTDFTEGPEGGSYNLNSSFVVITKNGNRYEYYATIVEEFDEVSKRGLNLISRNGLNDVGVLTKVVKDDELDVITPQTGGSLYTYAIKNVISS